MERTPVIAPPNVPVFIFTRTYDAPRALVWKAFTDPVLMAQWWGPEGTVNKIHALDVRVGGDWKFESAGEDGAPYTFWGQIVEVREGERIAQTFHFLDYPPNLDVLVLEDLGDSGTRMTSTTVLQSVEARAGMMAAGMEDGAQSCYDRLTTLLETLQGT